jgi:hypothetical protein
MKTYKKHILPSLLLIVLSGISACKPGAEGKSSKARIQDSIVLLSSNIDGTGRSIEIEMIRGKSHNHPTFAIWIEDTNGKYIQTLFVTQAIGQGIFNYGDKSGGKWKPGEVRRPAALPYWSHKRGINNEFGTYEPSPKNKVPDAYSGATPVGSFKLNSRTDNPLKGKVKLLFEVNQPWDWNEYWNNTLYTDDENYKTSCQPAVVYSAIFDMDAPGTKIEMKPAGHSHYSGKNGELFPDLSTITTALHIAEKISVVVK